MNTEYRLRRLEQTLGTLISWSQIELGLHNTNTLLDMLNAPEDPNCLEGPEGPEGLHPVEAQWRDIARGLRKERDEARSLVAAFESAVNQHCTFDPPIEKDRAVSEVDYIFRLNKEIRERVEKVIGHWRNTDWFREGGLDVDITVGVNEAEAIKLLKYLKP